MRTAAIERRSLFPSPPESLNLIVIGSVVTPSPLVGEGGGGGLAGHFQTILQMDKAARPPSLTLPHKGGGDPLRPFKLTDATD